MTTDPTRRRHDRRPGTHADDGLARRLARPHGLTDLGYIQVAVALAIITGLEVYASYTDWLGRRSCRSCSC